MAGRAGSRRSPGMDARRTGPTDAGPPPRWPVHTGAREARPRKTRRYFDRPPWLYAPMRVFLAALAATISLLAGTAAAAQAQAPGAQPALQRALSSSLANVGTASGAYVVDLDTGQTLFALAPDTGRMPASLEKIYTTSTAP